MADVACLRRRLVVAAALTLVLTGVRLLGELRGWPAPWFSPAAGGGGALVGIVWLVPLVGAWLAHGLVCAGERPARPWRTLAWHLLAVAVYLGGFQVAGRIDGSTHGGLVGQLLAMGGMAALAAAIAWRAWPALGRVDAVYGVLARVPTAVLTWFAVHGHWGTHLEKLGRRDFTGMGDDEAAGWLMYTQFAFWVPFTVVVGGLAGAAVALSGKPRGAVNGAAAAAR